MLWLDYYMWTHLNFVRLYPCIANKISCGKETAIALIETSVRKDSCLALDHAIKWLPLKDYSWKYAVQEGSSILCISGNATDVGTKYTHERSEPMLASTDLWQRTFIKTCRRNESVGGLGTHDAVVIEWSVYTRCWTSKVQYRSSEKMRSIYAPQQKSRFAGVVVSADLGNLRHELSLAFLRNNVIRRLSFRWPSGYRR